MAVCTADFAGWRAAFVRSIAVCTPHFAEWRAALYAPWPFVLQTLQSGVQRCMLQSRLHLKLLQSCVPCCTPEKYFLDVNVCKRDPVGPWPRRLSRHGRRGVQDNSL